MTTLTKTKHIDELHFEHQLWLSEIAFFQDELNIYQKSLEGLLSKDISADFKKAIERFQNKFLIQNNQLADWRHHINMHEQWLAKYAEKHPVDIDKELFANHAKIKENAESFKKIYNELKVEFRKFAADYYHP